MNGIVTHLQVNPDISHDNNIKQFFHQCSSEQSHHALRLNIHQIANNSDGKDNYYEFEPYDSGETKFHEGYDDGGHVINRTNRSILPDLKSYNFCDEIKNCADVIYNKMNYRVRRGKIRNQMIFFCVYSAHIELNIDIDPISLGAQFNLTSGEVQRCDSLFSPLQTGYRPPSTNTSPTKYLPNYCQRLALSDDSINEVRKLSNIILRKDPTLFQENPQTVAAGLLRYFIITNGITTDDPQTLGSITGRSNVTIENMYRRISSIDNS